MVDVDPAEWDARRKAGKLEDLSELDKSIIGWPTGKRLVIPITHAFTVRRVAELFSRWRPTWICSRVATTFRCGFSR
jgi:hypothetical protein